MIMKVSQGPVFLMPGVLSVMAMLLGKVGIILGHKVFKPGSLSSQRCQRLPSVFHTFLFCLNQLVLFVDFL